MSPRPCARPLILATAGLKGGTGKTTAAIAIATAAREQGARALLVDLDPLGTLRAWATAGSGASVPVLAGAALGPGLQQLQAIALGFDVVVLDAPAGDVQVLRACAAVADVVVVPTNADAPQVWALGATAAALGPATPLWVLRRAVARRSGAAAQLRRDLAATSGSARAPGPALRVLTSVLFDDRDYPAALARGQGPVELDADGPVAAECRALWRELAAIAVAVGAGATAVDPAAQRA